MTASDFLLFDLQSSADVIGNPRKPSMPEALEAAWAKSRRSLEGKLRLDSMLEDVLYTLSWIIEIVEDNEKVE